MKLTEEEVKHYMEFCIRYLNGSCCDVYTAMFWICSYISYVAAINTGKFIVNVSAITSCNYSAEIWNYRCAYAHNNLDELNQLVATIAYVIPDNIFYTEPMKCYISQCKEIFG